MIWNQPTVQYQIMPRRPTPIPHTGHRSQKVKQSIAVQYALIGMYDKLLPFFSTHCLYYVQILFV